MAQIVANAKKTAKPQKTNTRPSSIPSNEQEEIAKLAYQFFVERGFEHGHDQEDWLRAEAVIRNRRS